MATSSPGEKVMSGYDLDYLLGLLDDCTAEDYWFLKTFSPCLISLDNNELHTGKTNNHLTIRNKDILAIASC